MNKLNSQLECIKRSICKNGTSFDEGNLESIADHLSLSSPNLDSEDDMSVMISEEAESEQSWD